MGQIATKLKSRKKKKEQEQICPVVETKPVVFDEVVDRRLSYETSVSTQVSALNDSFHFPLGQHNLVTPRRPLGSVRSPTKSPPLKRLKAAGLYLNFPILQDDETYHYILKTKVMVIMKGLPGSGKSTICKKLKELYPQCGITSADLYFMKGSKYEFDFSKLKEAHEFSQSKAQEFVEEERHLIIVDNTNVKFWEMKYYLKLARENNYTVIVIEPKTPWAFDPEILAEKNKHGVSEDILSKKVNSYDDVLPIYYGWFLNEEDSQALLDIGHDWLRSLTEIAEFSDFYDLTGIEPEDIFGYFTKNSFSGGGGILHCTAAFTGKGKKPGAMEYIGDETVHENMGKCFSLEIIGFFITPRTFGARVKLGQIELKLWDKEDIDLSEEMKEVALNGKEGKAEIKQDCGVERKKYISNQSDSNSRNGSFVSNTNDVTNKQTLEVKAQELGSDRFAPTFGRGSRAHITLGCAPREKPVTTGFDLLDIIDVEQKGECARTFDINRAVVKNYESGIWVVYPEDKIVLKTFFTAYY